MELEARARAYAALGDRVRLAIVDDLAVSDRSPTELARLHGLRSNLLAHHLDVLEEAGLISRTESSGDRRRRYVHLNHERLAGLGMGGYEVAGPVLFVCTHNSARSQLAAALWRREHGGEVASAGTHPARRVHPGAVAAARRAGLDISDAVPVHIEAVAFRPARVITVCDRAHEELAPGDDWWHWSIPDPVEDPSPEGFDAAMSGLAERVRLFALARPR